MKNSTTARKLSMGEKRFWRTQEEEEEEEDHRKVEESGPVLPSPEEKLEM